MHGNSRIKLYDIAKDRVIEPDLRSREGFSVIGGAATVVGFLPDSKTLLTLGGGTLATVLVWDIEAGKEQSTFAIAAPNSDKDGRSGRAASPTYTTRRATLSPDGKSLAFRPDYPEGSRAENSRVPVRLWDVATGKAKQELHEPINPVVIPDEEAVRESSRLGAGLIWPLKSMDGRAFSPDGQLLADWAEHPSGRSWLDHISVWHATSGRLVANLAAGPRRGAANAAFAPDGRTLATASADGAVRLWETATWKMRAEFRGHRDRITALAFSPDGRLFTGGLDSVVFGWDVRPTLTVNGTLAEAWTALADGDAKVGFQAQGRFLAQPAQAVEWFSTHVAPAIPLPPDSVKKLITGLDHDTFAVRERAAADLRKLWPDTEPALRDFVSKATSLEARRRAEGIIGEMERAITPPGTLRLLRAVELLEWIGTKEARTLLLDISKGAPDALLTRAAAAACKRLGN